MLRSILMHEKNVFVLQAGELFEKIKNYKKAMDCYKLGKEFHRGIIISFHRGDQNVFSGCSVSVLPS